MGLEELLEELPGREGLMKHRKVPAFLRDPERAFRWAMKNVADLEPEYNEVWRERAELYSDFAHDVYRRGSLEIHRAIRVPMDGAGDPIIVFPDLGKAWSKNPEGAGVYGMVPPEGVAIKDVVLTGVVKAPDIDWEYGFTSFMYYGEDQWEVSLLPDVPVLVTHLDGDPLPRPIEGNSGRAQEIWRDAVRVV